MVQIIEENRTPGFRERLLGGLGAAAQQGSQMIPQMMAENRSLRELTGHSLSGLSPELKQVFAQNILKSQESKPDLSVPMAAINKLESLIGEKGIGKFSSRLLTEQGRVNRGEFESTQAALMPLFKSMFPRGMTEKEFKFVNEHYIPQPTDTEATIRGKLKGLRDLMGGGQLPQQIAQKERPPLSSFKK